MNHRVLSRFVLAIILVSAAGCATMETAGHKYIMRGQILHVANDEAYLCVGSRDGAKAGQELAVFRFAMMPSVTSKATMPVFKREAVGRIKIVQIVDEHYATARILRGDVRANDVVELEE